MLAAVDVIQIRMRIFQVAIANFAVPTDASFDDRVSGRLVVVVFVPYGALALGSGFNRDHFGRSYSLVNVGNL